MALKTYFIRLRPRITLYIRKNYTQSLINMKLIERTMSLFDSVISKMKYTFLIFCSCFVLICLMIKIISILNGVDIYSMKTVLTECYLNNNLICQILDKLKKEESRCFI
jgi:hypothetical protein